VSIFRAVPAVKAEAIVTVPVTWTVAKAFAVFRVFEAPDIVTVDAPAVKVPRWLSQFPETVIVLAFPVKVPVIVRSVVARLRLLSEVLREPEMLVAPAVMELAWL